MATQADGTSGALLQPQPNSLQSLSRPPAAREKVLVAVRVRPPTRAVSEQQLCLSTDSSRREVLIRTNPPSSYYRLASTSGPTVTASTVELVASPRGPSAPRSASAVIGPPTLPVGAVGAAGATFQNAAQRDRPFAFDAVFGPEASQAAVYQSITETALVGLPMGINGTILVYGQTNSGKTHTLVGPQGGACPALDETTPQYAERGIIPRVLDDLFPLLRAACVRGGSGRPGGSGGLAAAAAARSVPDARYRVRLQYYEIYRERFRDLLLEAGVTKAKGTSPGGAASGSAATGGGAPGVGGASGSFFFAAGGGGGSGAEPDRELLDGRYRDLKIREDVVGGRGVFVEGLTEVTVRSAVEARRAVARALQQRRMASTAMNLTSSRSHTVLTVLVEIRRGDGSGGTARGARGAEDAPQASRTLARLTLVDLAGSEKVSKTLATGQQLREAQTINKSLTLLGNVIYRLTDGHSVHIPYRDSKLTRVLQEALGGNSKTAMVVCVAPEAEHQVESMSSLLFASRAKLIETAPRANEELSYPDLLAQHRALADLNRELRQRIGALENLLRSGKSRGLRTMSRAEGVPSEAGEDAPGSERRGSGVAAADAETAAALGRERERREELEATVARLLAERAEVRGELHDAATTVERLRRFVVARGGAVLLAVEMLRQLGVEPPADVARHADTEEGDADPAVSPPSGAAAAAAGSASLASLAAAAGERAAGRAGVDGRGDAVSGPQEDIGAAGRVQAAPPAAAAPPLAATTPAPPTRGPRGAPPAVLPPSAILGRSASVSSATLTPTLPTPSPTAPPAPLAAGDARPSLIQSGPPSASPSDPVRPPPLTYAAVGRDDLPADVSFLHRAITRGRASFAAAHPAAVLPSLRPEAALVALERRVAAATAAQSALAQQLAVSERRLAAGVGSPPPERGGERGDARRGRRAARGQEGGADGRAGPGGSGEDGTEAPRGSRPAGASVAGRGRRRDRAARAGGGDDELGEARRAEQEARAAAAAAGDRAAAAEARAAEAAAEAAALADEVGTVRREISQLCDQLETATAQAAAAGRRAAASGEAVAAAQGELDAYRARIDVLEAALRAAGVTLDGRRVRPPADEGSEEQREREREDGEARVAALAAGMARERERADALADTVESERQRAARERRAAESALSMAEAERQRAAVDSEAAERMRRELEQREAVEMLSELLLVRQEDLFQVDNDIHLLDTYDLPPADRRRAVLAAVSTVAAVAADLADAVERTRGPAVNATLESQVRICLDVRVSSHPRTHADHPRQRLAVAAEAVTALARADYYRHRLESICGAASDSVVAAAAQRLPPPATSLLRRASHIGAPA